MRDDENALIVESEQQATVSLELRVPQTQSRTAAAVYLASLGLIGRRGMLGALNTIASLVTPGLTAETFPWHQLRYEHIVLIREKLAEHYESPASINHALSALRGVLREAFHLGMMSAEDYGRCKAARSVKGSRIAAGRALADDEVAALFLTCSAGSPIDVRDAALLAVLLGTGLRRSEVVGLDVEHFTHSTGALKVLGKGNKERLTYVTNEAKEYLDRWLLLRGSESGPLFFPLTKGGKLIQRRLTDQSVLVVAQRRAHLAKIPNFSPHDLRRSFVSNAIEASKDLIAVRDLVGHANVSTTARYDRRAEKAKLSVAKMIRLPAL